MFLVLETHKRLRHSAALGHVRLSILDLSPEAQQPFHDVEDTVHAVITGEFYNWEDIRADLMTKGHIFRSHCDSEILIALYKEHGMSMMDHLRGEFAFVLYDSENEVIIASRDRYGVKPLFYTVHDGRLLIASEMKAFLAFGWQPEWDVQSLLENAYLIDTRTLFQGIQRIQAGHYMSVQSFSTIAQTEYWDMEYADKVSLLVGSSQVIDTKLVLLLSMRLRREPTRKWSKVFGNGYLMPSGSACGLTYLSEYF